MDIGIHVVKTVNIFGFELWITESMVNVWLIGLVLIIAALIIRRKILKPKKIPAGVQNVIEWIVELLDKFTTSTMGEKGIKFSSFYGCMFIFILVCNLSGLLVGPLFNKWKV